MNIIEKMKKDWDRRAIHNDKFWIATGHHNSNGEFIKSSYIDVKNLLNNINIDSSWEVLEIGCGIGRLLRTLSDSFNKLYGVDVSKEMIKKGKKWINNYNNIKLFESNGINLDLFEPNKFDFVYSYITFQHVPKEIFFNYICESNRVLKQNGIFKFQICIENCFHPINNPFFEDTMGLRVYSKEEILEQLTKNNFEVYNLHNLQDFDWFITCRKIKDINVSSSLDLSKIDCSDSIFHRESEMYVAYAKEHLNEGKDEEAISTMAELININPDYVERMINFHG